MHKAVFLDLDSTSRDDLDLSRLQTACGELLACGHTRPGERLRNIGDADIVISNKVVLDAPLLRSLAGQVKLVCVAATGTNNVDLNAAQELGIPVANIRDYATRSVTEHVLALIFALRRQLPAWQAGLQRGDWRRSQHFCLLDYPMGEIAGSALTIIGYGVLGKAVGQMAQALGMNVVVAEHPGQPAREGCIPFEEALAQADILSLHCPLTADTRNLINAERLQLLKPDCILINTARGGIVDETALLQALQAGKLGGAGIDVLAQEPPGEDSPLLRTSLPNLIVTPHVAWASRKARQTLVDQLADVITSWRQGEVLNRVV